MTHHTEEPLMSILEAYCHSKGYTFKREQAFAFKGHRYALDAVATKGSESIGFELKTHARNIDYIFYRLLAYGEYDQKINRLYLVLPVETSLERNFIRMLRNSGVGLIRADQVSKKTEVEMNARPLDFAKNRLLLAHALHLSADSSDIFDKALHLFGRETPFDVIKEFVDSVLNNVLLGGLLASGIVLVVQNHIHDWLYIDVFAFGFIALALVAWVIRLAMAYGLI